MKLYAIAAVSAAFLLLVGWLVVSGSDHGGDSSEIRGSRGDLDWREELVRRGTEELQLHEPGRMQRLAFLRGAPEVMPVVMKRAIENSVGGASALGLRFDRAQLLPTTTGVEVWVTEGDGVTCISLAGDGSTACDTSLRAWRQGLPLQVASSIGPMDHRPTDFLAIGVVPNWANGVRMRVRGKPENAPASYGAYGVRASAPIRYVHPVR